MRRERVLVLYLNRLTNHARVLRQIDFLAAEYDVVVAAFDRPTGLPDVDLLELEPAPPPTRRLEAGGRLGLRLAGRYRSAYWLDGRTRRWRQQLQRALPLDAVVVNDLFGMPLACALGAPVVFDSHEHWTSESASWSRTQRLSMRGAHDWIVDRHVRRAAGLMTVSAGIARDYAARGIAEPAVVTNAPFHRPLTPSPVTEPIRLLHFGFADPRRRLEDTIEAVGSLDERFTLDLVLDREGPYRRRLVDLAAADPRIRILPRIPNAELISFANGYDVGVFLLPDHFPNQVHVLPNKLFDYVQARLALAIGPSPEMAAIAREWDCGVVSEDFTPTSFAAALERLTVAEVERMKRNADRAAAVLTADNNRETVIELVRGAIASGTTCA